ncbi:hypothetical protein N431DRAFT_401256 [Stipitochalara longipes BDJ]|nr:hypothetical protein N431DRAFT_401256 [Stipitochalara longipes BDJ]
MAPMTRSHGLVPLPLSDGRARPNQAFRETSWQFAESETRSERELSEEPPSSYDEEADVEFRGDEEDAEYDDRHPPLESPEDHEDILHPLREAANRVGREVEKFAEILDRYNPQRATASDEKHEMTVELIGLYHEAAAETVKRLREKHASERRKKDGLRWRKKMRGFSVTHDDDDMDLEDSEGNESPLSEQRTSLEDLERWEEEAHTWDLLNRLVSLRFSSSKGEADGRAISRARPIHQYSSEREIWDNFLETDELALERKTVLQWLKDTADESGEDIDILVQDLQQNADRGDIIAHGWLHTKAAIKGKKRLHSSPQSLDPTLPSLQRGHFNASGTEPLITQLDPDATTRQKRKLEAQDEYFERAIWLGCYEMLRRGKNTEDIREWCMERTEVWRAVSMSGFPDEALTDDHYATSGSSALWRRMCFALARKGGGDEYERAVYGILSGDIQSVEPVCRSWDDFVFIHYNALLKTQFDNYLQIARPQPGISSTTPSFGVFDAVQFHGDPNSAGKRLVETLKIDSRTIRETCHPMKMLQGVLIANEFSHFIYQQGLALSKFANANGISSLIPPNKSKPEKEDITKYIALDDHDSLRVLTHVLLVFMALGLDLGGIMRETEVENVIVAYISFLRLAGKEELIPLYCSQLSGKRKYAILCRNLIDVTDHEQRITQIRLMRELGLDVQEFVSLQARFLLGDYNDTTTDYPATGNFKLLEEDSSSLFGPSRKVTRDFLGDDPDKVERIDMLLIRSLEWYLLVDGLWSETFTVGSMLYLRFFKHLHLNAARTLASRITSNAIAKCKTRAILGDSIDFFALETGEDEDVTEVLDGSGERKRLLRKHLLAEAKSFRELETLIECLDNIETISSMAALMKEDGASAERNWRGQLAKAFLPTRATIQPLLNGWLLTSPNEGLQMEFKLLREAYLPETLLAYIVSLQFAGNVLTRDYLMECMELSALIAEENSDLLKLFIETGRMQELVEALAMASKSLLLVTSARQASGSRSSSKKMRLKGFTQSLWNVKP